jgi:hypothetical protein
MAEIADAAGVAVDSVDAGQIRFARPDVDRRTEGPLSAVLAARLAGSSGLVDASGTMVTQRGDGLANERTGGDA